MEHVLLSMQHISKSYPGVQALDDVSLRLDRGQIILMAKSGEAWQFEADDNAQWRRVPDTADPLIMLRQ